MCLRTSRKRPSTAKTDITCYKAVIPSKVNDKSFISEFTDFIYDIGKTYETKIGELQDLEDLLWTNEEIAKGYRIIEEGFHSFIRESDAIDWIKIDSRLRNKQACVIECTIPAGSQYFPGYTSTRISYVSNKIEVNRIVFNFPSLIKI